MRKEGHMANEEHLATLRLGVDVWNQWRIDNPDVQPDLSEANLRGWTLSKANLIGADLSRADLTEADMCEAILYGADLHDANLRGAYLSEADLRGVNLCGADLNEANLIRAILSGTYFSKANLCRAYLNEANLNKTDLSGANLNETNLEKANLTGCRIYGISAWNANLEETTQADLIITREDETTITVDNLEVAQFMYLLLNNKRVRDVIDTVTSKAVLILGRFTPERIAVLGSLRSELRQQGFVPILFDFDKPTSRNLTETVSTLAHMARFVIADLTDAKSIPQELQRIVPELPSLPVQPIILASQYEYSMFIDLQDYPWVLPIHRYTDTDALLTQLDALVIAPALTKAEEIAERRKALEEEMAKERKDKNKYDIS